MSPPTRVFVLKFGDGVLMKMRFLLRPVIGTALLLSIPLVMTLVDRDKAPGSGWHWGPLDFAVMGALLLAAGTLYEFVSTRMRAPAHRAVLGLVIAGLVLAIWVELAVGGISQLVGWATA